MSTETKSARLPGNRRSEGFAWEKMAMLAIREPKKAAILKEAGDDLAEALVEEYPTEAQQEAALKIVVQAYAEGKLEPFGFSKP